MDQNPIDTQKQLILRNEFKQVDIEHNEPVSLQVIQQALDDKLRGQKFDTEITTQLFEQMSMRNDSLTTIDEFIKVYLSAEKILIQKIEQSKEYLQNYQRQARETKNKIQSVKTTERINDHGITEDSVFNFTVLSAAIANSDYPSDFSSYVKITCGQNDRKTDPSKSLYPQYNFTNSFLIETGDEEIKFILIDNLNKQTIGFSQINISHLKSQAVFDTELELLNDYRNVVGSLKVQMRWIHSKVKYLEDVLRKWEEYAAAQSSDLEDYQRDLLTLYEPFKLLQIYNRNQLNQNNFQSIGSNSNPFQDEVQGQTQFQGQRNTVQQKANFPDANQGTPEGGFNTDGILNPGSQDYKKIALYATYGYLLMVLFISFQRTMFIDYLDYQLKEEFTGQIYKYFTISIFISFVVFDLGWIINYTKLWFGGDYPDYGIRYFVDLLTILLFLFKLFIMVIYILNWNHYEQGQALIRGSVNVKSQLQQQQQGFDFQNNLNSSNQPLYPQDNFSNNNFLSNLNNPKFNQQTPNSQQYDTMKVTRYY